MDLSYESNPLTAFCLDCTESVPLAIRIVCRRFPDHQSVKPDSIPHSWADLSHPIRGFCLTCDPPGNYSNRANRELCVQLICTICKSNIASPNQIAAMCQMQYANKKSSKQSGSQRGNAPTNLPAPLAPALSDSNNRNLQELKQHYGSHIPESEILPIFSRCKYDYKAASEILKSMVVEKQQNDEIDRMIKSQTEILEEKLKHMAESVQLWFECIDSEKKSYYSSPTTGATTWDIPSDLKGLCSPSDEWEPVQTPEGKYYFVHSQSKSTAWQRPLKFHEDVARKMLAESQRSETLVPHLEASHTQLASRSAETHPISKEEASSLMEKKRFDIYSEVIDSEKKYIDYLTVISDVFYKPLKGYYDSGSLDIKSFRPLLDSLEFVSSTLINLNMRILDEFKSLTTDWKDNKEVSNVFSKVAPRLKLYSTYITNYPNAVRILKLHSSTREFKLVCQNALLNPRCEGKTLESFLIMPVQRVPRYVLFLKTLASITNADHPDHRHIQEALHSLDSVAVFLNDTKRTSESSSRIQALQEHYQRSASRGAKILIFSIPGRNLLMESIVHHKIDFRSPRKRHVLLFNDVLVVCKVISDDPPQVEYRDMCFVSDMTYVAVSISDAKCISISRKANVPYNTPNSTLTFIFNSDDESNRWNQELQERLKSYGSRKMSSADYFGRGSSNSNLTNAPTSPPAQRTSFQISPQKMRTSKSVDRLYDIVGGPN